MSCVPSSLSTSWYRYSWAASPAIMSMYLLREDCTSPGGYAASIKLMAMWVRSSSKDVFGFMFVSLVPSRLYILGRINFIQDHKIQRLADKRRRNGGHGKEVGHHGGEGAWSRGGSWTGAASDDDARKRCDTVLRYAIILVCITAVVDRSGGGSTFSWTLTRAPATTGICGPCTSSASAGASASRLRRARACSWATMELNAAAVLVL